MSKYFDENGMAFDMIREDDWLEDETLLNLARVFDLLED